MPIKIHKRYWSEVRKSVQKIQPELAALIDEIQPGDECFFYEAEYDYADLMLDKGSWFLPKVGGGTIPLTDPSIPKKIVQELNYNMYTNPTFIVLKKSIECFIEVPHQPQPHSVYLLNPGQLLGLSGVVKGLPSPSEIHPQNSVWNISAGARNTFFTHKITNADGNARLHRLFELPLNKPKTLNDHWHFFKSIYQQSPQEWKCSLLMFSRSWFTHLHDKAWRGLKLFFLEKLQELLGFWSNTLAWNVGFSQIHFMKNINTSSLAALVTKHILAVGTGKVLGFAPAQNNQHLPAETLVNTYQNIYGASDYVPILMQPESLNYTSKQPIYVSLHRLNIEENYLYQNLPSSLKLLDEIQYTLKKFLDALKKQNVLIDAPHLKKVAEKISFDFFHSVESEHKGILDSNKLKKDGRFDKFRSHKNQKFPRAGKFFRGCIRLNVR